MNFNKIALMGAGQMGSALLAGWLGKRQDVIKAEDLVVIDPNPSEAALALIEAHNLTHVGVLDSTLASEIDVVVLAIKPQMLDRIGSTFAPLLKADCAIVSIMAGPSIQRIQEVLGKRPVIRAMPNTPAAIGAGIAVCVLNDAAAPLKSFVTSMLKATGEVEWVDDEKMISAATAVSGSGPAYVYLLAEAMAGAGVAEGLPAALADKLARQTIIGSGALLASSGRTPQELRRMVTSPGGTTQAALDVLIGRGGGLPEIIRQAVNAAERRSREMANGKR